MLLFDDDIVHPLNLPTLANQKRILATVMCGFRSFPLCEGGYSEEKLRFYDGVLGSLIRMRDKMVKSELYDTIDKFAEFSSHWEYHGDIYRIIGKSWVYPKDENRESYFAE